MSLNKNLIENLIDITSQAAISCYPHLGKGNKMLADKAATDVMRYNLNKLNIDGEVVIGEGELDEAPMLYIGEKLGNTNGPKIDIAVDPVEGTNFVAKNLPGAISVLAISEKGNLFKAPETYMNKIAIGPGYPEGIIDLDASPSENIISIAKAKGVSPEEITVCILDRERHASHIESTRSVGASVYLIPDGDVAGVIMTTQSHSMVDVYMGIGGAPEGVLAAAALQCIGGQMQARLVINNDDEKERATKIGISDLNKKYYLNELASGDIIFSATGVTEGTMVKGIRKLNNHYVTHSLVLRTSDAPSQYIETHHLI
mgnify:CR=1 FL=1